MNGVDGVVLVVIQITDDPSAEQTAPPCSTHVHPGDISHALVQQGERERCHGREREAPGAWGASSMRLPTIYRGGGAGFLPSKSIGALDKVGGKKSHYFLPHRLLSPLFRDLDLIPSGYDLIPSKVGSWCALTRGVGPCPHYPRSCGSPHAGGPHSGTF